MGIPVQTATNTGTSNSIGATWGQNTTAGNLLVALVAFYGTSQTVTAPAGWVQVGSTTNNGSCNTTLWYYANAPAQGSTGNFSVTTTPTCMAIMVAEYNHIILSSPEDGSGNSSTGMSSSPATGSQTTANANDLLVGSVAQAASVGPSITFSAPTNSFTLETQVQASGGGPILAVGLVDELVTSTGTYSSGVTSTKSTTWCGQIAAFKQVPAPSVNLIRPRVLATPFNPALYE
jgi:hypothetical protein